MNLKDKLKTLGKVLNEGASINFPGDHDFYPNTIRWSEYAAPQPGAVINVATETDVQKTVQWAIQNDVESLAQTGGHGWTTSWNLGDSGVLINLRGLNNVAVNLKDRCAIIEAGALVGEVINAAKVYVNYATGDEPIEEKYGYDEDRLKKLRDLKNGVGS